MSITAPCAVKRFPCSTLLSRSAARIVIWRSAVTCARSRRLPPRCPCGGLFRPAVVWFGEALPPAVLAAAHEEAEGADLFVSIGTSGVVYPAAGLIEVAHRAGALLVEVNPEPTPFSSLAALRFAEPAGLAVPRLLETFERCRSPA